MPSSLAEREGGFTIRTAGHTNPGTDKRLETTRVRDWSVYYRHGIYECPVFTIMSTDTPGVNFTTTRGAEEEIYENIGQRIPVPVEALMGCPVISGRDTRPRILRMSSLNSWFNDPVPSRPLCKSRNNFGTDLWGFSRLEGLSVRPQPWKDWIRFLQNPGSHHGCCFQALLENREVPHLSTVQVNSCADAVAQWQCDSSCGKASNMETTVGDFYDQKWFSWSSTIWGEHVNTVFTVPGCLQRPTWTMDGSRETWIDFCERL